MPDTLKQQTPSDRVTGETVFGVHYAGLVPDISADEDSSSRTNVLKLIDRAQKTGALPRRVSNEHRATLTVDTYALFVHSASDGELLLSVPIHMLMSACFVEEPPDEDIVAIKIGEVTQCKDLCDLVVLYCDSAEQASRICLLMNQCFQQVFTEAFVQFSEKRVAEGHTRALHFMDQRDDASKSVTTDTQISEHQSQQSFPLDPSFVSGSRSNLKSELPKSSTSESEQNSAFCADLIQAYMIRLQAMLSVNELKQFALLMKNWRAKKLPLAEFCQKVLELYGSERKHLLIGLRPFIPDSELGFFHEFIRQCGISANVECSLSSNSPASTGLSPDPPNPDLQKSGFLKPAGPELKDCSNSVSDYSGTMVEGVERSVSEFATPLALDGAGLQMIELETLSLYNAVENLSLQENMQFRM